MRTIHSLGNQLVLLRLHWELHHTLRVLDFEDDSFESQIEATIISVQKRFIPSFDAGNPLLGYTPGTELWDKQIKSIERRHAAYMESLKI